MKNKTAVTDIALAAMFLATAFVLPFFTGQIPQIGNMLCPMHLPVILCGYICGGPWGLVVGFVAPLLRSFIIGAPTLFPRAVAMAFELAAYGFFSGFLYRVLPKKKVFVYVSLVSSMVIGRVIWGVVQIVCVGFNADKFGLAAFWSGAVANAIPGIIIQLLLIPVLVIVLEKTALKEKKL